MPYFVLCNPGAESQTIFVASICYTGEGKAAFGSASAAGEGEGEGEAAFGSASAAGEDEGEGEARLGRRGRDRQGL